MDDVSTPELSTLAWWRCNNTWKSTFRNTAWCLIGCAIGDIGTILYFQLYGPNWPVSAIMFLAIINGLISSILLETIILSRQMSFFIALKTASGMSLISMLGMEIAMNLTDIYITGGAIITWGSVPFILLAGYIAPLPYNYWRLRALGLACH